MRALDDLFRQYATRADARYWIGRTPTAAADVIARAIAGRIGYPTATPSPFAVAGMVRLDRRQAAHVLAVAGTTSLAYGTAVPREKAVAAARRALALLAADAVFLSNGSWVPGRAIGWQPMTSATFDCGVIGHDAENAFIFWVEEED